jgi:hypothetical protein
MATVKATNPTTGKQFDINEAEFATTYKPLGWTLSSGSSATTTPSPNLVDINLLLKINQLMDKI